MKKKLHSEMTVPEGVAMAIAVIQKLSEGKRLTLKDVEYPIAMGVDGSIGFLYNQDRVVSDFTFSNLVRIIIEHDVRVIP